MSAPSITLSPGGGFLLEPTGSVTIFTPEMLSDEQRMMKETADDFLMKEVMPRVAEIESKKPGVMRDLMQKAGSVGFLGHDIPEAYGGLGGDKTSAWREWYEENIPRADAIYEEYLAELRAAGLLE